MKRRKFKKFQLKEIKRCMQKNKKRKIKDIKAYRRLLVLHMRALGKTNKEISEVTMFSCQYITDLVTKYMNEGMESILIDKRTCNNRRMSFDKEAAFLEQFKELAYAGQIITVNNIWEKFEEETGEPCDKSTIYKLLKRHGWRKVKPRPEHPNKPSEEVIEASKKLTKNTESSCWICAKETNATKKYDIAV